MSANAIFAQAVKTGNAVIDVTADGVQYVAEAVPGSDPEAEAWKCYAVFPIGETGRFVKHAAGLHAPGWSGENLAGLTYLPEQES